MNKQTTKPQDTLLSSFDASALLMDLGITGLDRIRHDIKAIAKQAPGQYSKAILIELANG